MFLRYCLFFGSGTNSIRDDDRDDKLRYLVTDCVPFSHRRVADSMNWSELINTFLRDQYTDQYIHSEKRRFTTEIYVFSCFFTDQYTNLPNKLTCTAEK